MKKRYLIFVVIQVLVFASCMNKKECAKTEEIKKAIQNEQQFDIEILKFERANILIEVPDSLIGSFRKDSLILSNRINLPHYKKAGNILNEVAVFIRRAYFNDLIEQNIDINYAKRVDIESAFLLCLGKDTLLDIVTMGYDVAPSSYDCYYHVLINPMTYSYIGILESYYFKEEPFGDYNNDGKIDFLPYYDSPVSKTIALFTISKDKIESQPMYTIGLTFTNDGLEIFDKKNTEIQLLCGKKVVSQKSW